ncbi:hypothetical protein [Rhizobium johnstonii]|uniref:hypothetical protein n=1 Tax=Rhizobium johnstonii TaxID=3019933 RepID=UPI003F98535D
MEWLAGFMSNVLGLKARQGWVFLLVGGIMLLVLYYGLLPNEEIGIGWKAFFTLLAVTGIAILIVSAGSQIYESRREKAAANRKIEAAEWQQARLESDALRTAEILTGHDAAVLLSLLLKGKQRFTGGNMSSLHAKNIIKPIGSYSSTYEVVNSVWNERARLIPFLREAARK